VRAAVRRALTVLVLLAVSASPEVVRADEVPVPPWIDRDLLAQGEEFPPVEIVKALFRSLDPECQEKCRALMDVYVRALGDYEEAVEAWEAADAGVRFTEQQLARRPQIGEPPLNQEFLEEQLRTGRARLPVLEKEELDAERRAIQAERRYRECLDECRAIQEVRRQLSQYSGLVVQALAPAATDGLQSPRRQAPAPGRAPMRTAGLAEITVPVVPEEFGRAQVVLTGRGVSTGEAFDVEVSGKRRWPLRIQDEAVVVEPLRADGKTERPRGPVFRTSALGYCLEHDRPVAPQGTPYAVAPPAVQKRFRPLLEVLKTAHRVAAAGRLHPDSEPTAYAHSITQWAVWSREKGFDEASFGRAFLEHTRKNALAAGQKWSGDLEKSVRAAVPNRWRDIALVLAETPAPAAAGQ
jgi:hypothetical protein